jgi:hypothetical protein
MPPIERTVREEFAKTGVSGTVMTEINALTEVQLRFVFLCVLRVFARQFRGQGA